MALRWLLCPLIPLVSALTTLFILDLVRDGNPGSTNGIQSPPQVAKAAMEPSLLHSDTPAKLRSANAVLARQLKELTPAGLYLVIDTGGNRVILRRGENTLSEMVASCGSGSILQNPGDGRRWVFDTPRGQFAIQSKITDPVWIKPDWAYLEEGENIPKNSADRAQGGMMGDYALGIGHGYFIHGTLYTRLLGRNVSHGCVRLGENDLAMLYRAVPMGAKVVIF